MDLEQIANQINLPYTMENDLMTFSFDYSSFHFNSSNLFYRTKEPILSKDNFERLKRLFPHNLFIQVISSEIDPSTKSQIQVYVDISDLDKRELVEMVNNYQSNPSSL
ncbi:hypothetical protein J4223_00860 [Candidatus Woesearchaeota archaeon]|nr:hypothetical protein [Candidatus Woesearchaeota archaeon]